MYVCPSSVVRLLSVGKLPPILAVISQNVNNKSCLLCVQSEKYAFWVTLRPVGSMKQAEAKIHALRYFMN